MNVQATLNTPRRPWPVRLTGVPVNQPRTTAASTDRKPETNR